MPAQMIRKMQGGGLQSAMRTPTRNTPIPNGSPTAPSPPSGIAQILAFPLNSSVVPVTQFRVSFAAISADDTTSIQAATLSQPEPSVDSRAAHTRPSNTAACSSVPMCADIRYLGAVDAPLARVTM